MALAISVLLGAERRVRSLGFFRLRGSVTELDKTNSTADKSETSLQKTDAAQMVTYAKWGLMGVGALALTYMATSLIFSPIGLLLLAGGGGAAWWQLKGKKRFTKPAESGAPATPDHAQYSPPTPPPRPRGLPPVPQRGSAAPLAPPSGPSPEVPGFAADELAEFDRRLSELDAVD
ncbi:MAG: hypothetical protein ACI81R_001094 [Bradymonadia bacterium]|jgi:hypothetical protein